jgi:hypothetical protein
MHFALGITLLLPGCASPFRLGITINRTDGLKLTAEGFPQTDKLPPRGVELPGFPVPITQLPPEKTLPPASESP